MCRMCNIKMFSMSMRFIINEHVVVAMRTAIAVVINVFNPNAVARMSC